MKAILTPREQFREKYRSAVDSTVFSKIEHQVDKLKKSIDMILANELTTDQYADYVTYGPDFDKALFHTLDKFIKRNNPTVVL